MGHQTARQTAVNAGTGAAVAKAIFPVSGKRVRDLPITPDKLL